MGATSHAPGKLVPVKLKSLPDGWHADGGNLYLLVRGNSRGWVFRYVAPNGKRRNMGLGSLLDVSLAQARKIAAELREQARHPLSPNDPLAARQQARIAERTSQARRMTFKACAERYIEAHRAEWKNPKHAQQWENTLARYAFPVIGDLPVADVDEALILQVLMPIWETKTETATRVRGRIESVLDWATFNKFRQGDNPARWKGHLDNSLSNPNKVAKVQHHSAMPYRRIAEFMAELRQREGMAARALEFLILTAARSGEVRGATWDEIDLDDRLWIVPASRMKAEREHRVPLSDTAVQLLKNLPGSDDDPLVFTSTKKATPLSDMAMTSVLRRMDETHCTVHGFRSTFRDWAAEITNYPRDMAEMALAHSVGDKVEAAYRRGDMLKKRFKMMNDWALYCASERKDSNVIVPIRRRKMQ